MRSFEGHWAMEICFVVSLQLAAVLVLFAASTAEETLSRAAKSLVKCVVEVTTSLRAILKFCTQNFSEFRNDLVNFARLTFFLEPKQFCEVE